MNALKNVFGRIWALWGLTTFFTTMMAVILFYLPCFLMKEPYAARWHRSVSRVWMTVYLTLIGCPIRSVNRNNYVKGRNYVVICNHRSLMDVPVTTPFLPNANKTIAKKSFALIPVFGWIYSLGSVLLDRKSAVSRRKSFDQMRKVLTKGLDMVIYPEGTRNRTSAPLKTFYDGAFRLAVIAEKPVIPVIIFNTDRVLPTNKAFYMMPHRLEMHYLPPVEVAANDNVNELKNKLFDQMTAYYAAHKKN